MPTIKTLTEDHANRLLHAIRNTHRSPATKRRAERDYLIAALLLDAGLRVGELVQLQVEDLYAPPEPKHTLKLRAATTKTHHDRFIPLTQRIQFAFTIHLRTNLKQLNVQTTPWLFPSLNPNNHLTTRQVQRIIQNAGHLHLAIDVNPHMLRHTFATALMRTTSIPIVQALLGHRSLHSTQIYMHPNNLDLQQAIDTIDTIKQGQRPKPA